MATVSHRQINFTFPNIIHSSNNFRYYYLTLQLFCCNWIVQIAKHGSHVEAVFIQSPSQSLSIFAHKTSFSKS